MLLARELDEDTGHASCGCSSASSTKTRATRHHGQIGEVMGRPEAPSVRTRHADALPRARRRHGPRVMRMLFRELDEDTGHASCGCSSASSTKTRAMCHYGQIGEVMGRPEVPSV